MCYPLKLLWNFLLIHWEKNQIWSWELDPWTTQQIHAHKSFKKPGETHCSNMMHSFFNSVQPLLLRGEASCIHPAVTNAQWSFFSACLDTPPFWKQETYPRQQPNNRLHSRGANKRERGQRGQEKPWQHLLRHTLGLSKFLPRPWHHNTTNYFVSPHSGTMWEPTFSYQDT